MKHRICVLSLIAMLTPAAHAIEWPWSDTQEVSYAYCKGFVVAGLAEFPVENLSRTNLWLAWNAVNRSGSAVDAAATDDYAAGRSEFDSLLGGGRNDELLDIANGRCALGRN